MGGTISSTPLPLNKLVDIGPVGVLALWEQIRARHLAGAPVATVPVDLFALGIGEPSLRGVTKVGGMPYRPSKLPWPERDGAPMTFLAQFRFTESRDHVGPLPGDILLVFVRSKKLDLFGQDPEYFHFEWYPLGLSELVEPESTPKPDWSFATCYGVKHRSVDFPNDMECDGLLRPFLLDYFPDLEAYDFDLQIASLLQWRRLKIGGIPDLGNVNVGQNQIHGLKFLGTIPTIRPPFEGTYRWINRPNAESVSFPYPPSEILEWWLDLAWINLFLEQNGEVVARLRSYGMTSTLWCGEFMALCHFPGSE